VLSLPDVRQATLNDVTMRHGEYFSPEGRSEVIVNDAFARAHHLRPGCTIGNPKSEARNKSQIRISNVKNSAGLEWSLTFVL